MQTGWPYAVIYGILAPWQHDPQDHPRQKITPGRHEEKYYTLEALVGLQSFNGFQAASSMIHL